MLIDFKVENFRSFKDEQEFSMQTGKRLRKYQKTNTMLVNHEQLLKSALLFGANANGKTNLIDALIYLRFLIVRPVATELQNFRTDTFGYNDNDTKFDISFIEDGSHYEYVLQYNKNEVTYETLNKNGKSIFKRNRQDFITLPKQLVPLKDNIRKNQLLLYFAQQNNEQDAKAAYKWFAEDLVFVRTDEVKFNKFKLLENPVFKKRFLCFLQAADFNITDIEVRERKENVPLLKDSDTDTTTDENSYMFTIYDVYITHKGKDKDFQVYFGNESTGTKVFITLALYILSNSNKTLVIDEFDRSYHLELAKALLALINSEKQTNQFILTTHELSLMDANLRQDQIWFAEKNRYGESELFSIFDFDDPALKRSDFNYKKRYLEGVYGATQLVNKDLLIAALNKDE